VRLSAPGILSMVDQPAGENNQDNMKGRRNVSASTEYVKGKIIALTGVVSPESSPQRVRRVSGV
jgi:hypothetical protein